jgi:hypothetical protein
MTYPVFWVLFPNQVIRADDLARSMVDVVIRRERGNLVFENRDIRAMVKALDPLMTAMQAAYGYRFQLANIPHDPKRHSPSSTYAM